MLPRHVGFQKRPRTFAACVTVVLVAMFSLWCYTEKSFTAKFRLFDGGYPSNNDTKRILVWAPFYGHYDFYFGMGHEPFLTHNCSVSDCTMTDDRQLLQSSDAVLFHFLDIDVNDMPKWRSKSQRWIFHLMESPNYSLREDKFQRLNSVFNWTMTYRMDSDIVTSYGKFFQRRATNDRESPPPLTDEEEEEDDVTTKTGLATWLVSHCSTSSKREEYIEELRKYIPVDIYGKCGRFCNWTDCESHLYSSYKFYLSFENSICRDYVTEKLYKVLMHQVVPVVFGGANYTAVAPPHSTVNARDFKSPKHLAEYLNELDRNVELYNRYFEWKKNYVVNPDFTSYAFCDLCAKLHQKNVQDKIYVDMYDWWITGGQCQAGFN